MLVPLLVGYWLEAWQRSSFLRRHAQGRHATAMDRPDRPEGLIGAHTPLMVWLQLHMLLLLSCLLWEGSVLAAGTSWGAMWGGLWQRSHT